MTETESNYTCTTSSLHGNVWEVIPDVAPDGWVALKLIAFDRGAWSIGYSLGQLAMVTRVRFAREWRPVKVNG
jgi:hypothetical protein